MLTQIPKDSENASDVDPIWVNGYLPGLDSVALYGFLSALNPENYIEIGSGNSTKFARRAILDNKLRTKITSIDPYPRAEIDKICDNIIRKPMEDVDVSFFEKMGPGDILFVDNSHRIFMNSDSTVVLLDILPVLKPGVIVEFHDIFLPYDYPPEWIPRYYSEQYGLAAYLLGGGHTLQIILANNFISNDPELSLILSPLWDHPRMKGVYHGGGSLWMQIV